MPCSRCTTNSPGLTSAKKNSGATRLWGLGWAARLRLAPAEELGVGEEVEVGEWDVRRRTSDVGFVPIRRIRPNPFHHEAFAEHALDQGDALGNRRLEDVGLDMRGEVHLVQEFLQAGGLACGQDDRVGAVVQLDHIRGDLLRLAAEARAGAERAGQGRVDGDGRTLEVAVPQEQRALLEQPGAQLDGGEERVGERSGYLAAALQLAAEARCLHLEFLRRGEQVQRVVHHQRSLRGQVVQQAGRGS